MARKNQSSNRKKTNMNKIDMKWLSQVNEKLAQLKTSVGL